jgi:hypothetical protein
VKKTGVDFLFVLNAAITNIRLYPPTSEIIQTSVARMETALKEVLADGEALEFAESGKNLLAAGQPLPEKQQQRPQIRSFLSMMLDFGIKSITFFPGITGPEISQFLQVMGKSAQEIQNAGGPGQLLENAGVSHIAIDEKIYVERDADRQIISGLDISDTDFVRYLLGEEDSADQQTIDQVREMAADPGWFARVFETGARYLLEQHADATRAEQTRLAGRMLDSLAGLSDADTEQILKSISEAFGQTHQDVGSADPADTIGKLLDQYKQAEAPPAPPGRPKTVKEALSRILKGDHSPFLDQKTADVLPKAAVQMARQEKQDMLAALTGQMGKALRDDSPEVRCAVARIMAETDEQMEAADRLDQRIAMSKKLVEWIKTEDHISEEYEQVTRRLENLAETIITQKDAAADAEHILEAYSLIRDGRLSKPEAIQALAANMLQHLSTDQILEMVLSKAGNTSDTGKEDIRTLVILGSTTIERLLDRLRDSHSMAERNRIVQAVSRMGNAAVQPVADRLAQGGPWFYIRNLALLLGRIGGPEHLSLLEPLLTYPDYRVQLEAVKSIQAIDGDKAGDMLLKHIPVVEPQLAGHIVSVLGAIRYQPAAPYLINLLESKSFWQNKAVRDEIRTKACEALGRMQAAEAVSALEKVVRTRGFFSGYPENIRAAAAKALSQIKRD